MGANYTVERQQSTTYLDNGQAVQGFLLSIRLHKWDELTLINVPSLDPNVIDARMREIIQQREALDQLGD